MKQKPQTGRTKIYLILILALIRENGITEVQLTSYLANMKPQFITLLHSRVIAKTLQKDDKYCMIQ